MKSAYIIPGDKLAIRMKTEDSAPKRVYESFVESVIDDKNMIVYSPLYKGQMIRLSTEEEYEFQFYSHMGLYRSKGVITENFQQNNISLLKIQVEQFDYIQRRDSYRVPAVFDFVFMRPAEAAQLGSLLPLYPGTVQNISVGGLLFTTDTLLQEQEQIQCNLTFDDVCVTALGHVLPILPAESSDTQPDTYVYRIRFSEINNHVQESILKFVFNKQREIILNQKMSASNQ